MDSEKSFSSVFFFWLNKSEHYLGRFSMNMSTYKCTHSHMHAHIQFFLLCWPLYLLLIMIDVYESIISSALPHSGFYFCGVIHEINLFFLDIMFFWLWTLSDKLSVIDDPGSQASQGHECTFCNMNYRSSFLIPILFYFSGTSRFFFCSSTAPYEVLWTAYSWISLLKSIQPI